MGTDGFSAADTGPPESDAKAEADVIVIGGGYTGLSSAIYLAEGGARASS